MAKKPKGLARPRPDSKKARLNAHWVVLKEFTPEGGLTMEPGTIFRIRGWRGRYKFLSYTFNPANNGEWITCSPSSRSQNPRTGTYSIAPSRVVPEKPKRKKRKK